MIIREEGPDDVKKLREMVYEAFKDHPRHEPNAEPTEHEIVDTLRDDGALALSLVAVDEGTLVGHVAFSPITIDGKDHDWFGLGPVAVIQTSREKGIGAALVQEGLEILRSRGAGGCVVLGDPSFYCRYGFEPDPRIILEGFPPEYFMALTFKKPTPNGTIGYHDAFKQ
ncbi:N-acetyltransferase [Rhodobacteraceae bacterium RKSG542]|uniref:GNAT family N-acetyltransferase n=1 Tax=Pseudovibrio flavus TaxID=2529854 RepID=UPI0012BC1281|nr:N-acetyltransferase [Pseudovibrio flavus]MTI16808.1 N-acetyltransferase [Pseudovibrio flavus]